MVVRLAMMKTFAYWGKYKLVYVDVKNTFASWRKGNDIKKYKPCTNVLFFTISSRIIFLLGLESYTSLNCIDFVEMFMMVKI